MQLSLRDITPVYVIAYDWCLHMTELCHIA